ncbi:two-component system, OmpR family, phosphate regulon response regulator PhoB [Paucidesulfovibrio gracilis DSM 16080]|uniref:Two-component system, OmpR family, phosphate regulon response regulator PhoB n=1 Tax=Paucidesulfovibrio gracilis DSM 16080 TaxID=1121449 RepID=A0A1T4XPL6_9BACT|nr:response regulator transcription factor [Paucidesulfovibrio gracilis]SKA91048.1 two-component system, OmpR family, phosphate regulon response regulator PhoB [Paucidesulfovibrio gracilis DSM 16080]
MAGNKILVVEDHQDTRELLDYNLSAAGFEVRTAQDGTSVMDLVRTFQPDLVLLDLMLPGMDGLEICRRLKKRPETSSMPVIMLTAKGEEVDRIVGLELGADDYVVKPFSPRELMLRIKAVLRRAPEVDEGSGQPWEREGLRVDFEAHTIEVDGESAQLTATEFKLLSELIKGKGKVQTRDHLLDTVWDTHFEGYSRTVDTHIRRLRQKLGAYADWIETVRGVGYRFKS